MARTLSSPVVQRERTPRVSETRYTVKVYSPGASRNERGALLFTTQLVSNARRIKTKIADTLLERGLHARSCSFAPDNVMIVVANPSTAARRVQPVPPITARKFRITKKEA